MAARRARQSMCHRLAFPCSGPQARATRVLLEELFEGSDRGVFANRFQRFAQEQEACGMAG